MYDKGLLHANEFDIPLIVVGNLRVGGTGKTPQVAYLVALLKKHYKVAVLSRGYKRQSKGFLLAGKEATARSIGDEPFQLFRQHTDIIVAVDTDRSNGIALLQKLDVPPQVIILDDAFQHRKVKAGFNILLTPYDDLYVDDEHLPTGNLRESVNAAERAQVLVVSKSPSSLTESQEFDTAKKLKPTLDQTVFFSAIQYDDTIRNDKEEIPVEELSKYNIILVTGIANPKPLVDFLNSKELDFQHLSFPDHHNFSKKDISGIQKQYNASSGENKLILTTEKDYVRIFANLPNLFYLGIETYFINHQSDFDKLILDYVEENTRDR